MHEILLKHEALPNTIRTGRISAIRGIIESSSSRGMCLMDTSIKNCLTAGIISEEEAYMKASDKETFAQLLNH